jgi:hypothetical protein
MDVKQLKTKTMINLQIACISTSHEIVKNEYKILKFDIHKRSLIISFCDCFGTEITASEISIEDAKELSKLLLTI